LIRALAVAGSSGDLVARAARTFVVNVLGVGLSFALHFVFARLLGVSDYGLYVYIISWVTVLSMLCVVGFDAASLRFVAEYRARAEHHALRAFLQFAKRRALAVSVSVAVVLAVLAEARQTFLQDNSTVTERYVARSRARVTSSESPARSPDRAMGRHLCFRTCVSDARQSAHSHSPACHGVITAPILDGTPRGTETLRSMNKLSTSRKN
jgi:hypothetical protein